ncbi:MAG: threonine synthase [Rhodospirillales bacterium]
MRYVSTRGGASAPGFESALLGGLAEDGGLYMPETLPPLNTPGLNTPGLRGAAYNDLAFAVMAPFIGEAAAEADLKRIIAEAYATFDGGAPAPLRQIGDKHWIMELFHGPTLAFKDIAMQVLARLFDHVLAKRGERTAIVGATSGDTGAAAMAAFAHTARADVFILFPEGRVSDVQRRQMTTIDAPNVHALEVRGTFDDCQDLVKAMLNDAVFRAAHNLGAVNSINWARVAAQIVYYLVPAAAGMGPVRFCVPTGNFGNVLAGYIAKQMGAPISGLIAASNANDILARFLETGVMERREVVKTISPSMDIQISSNFERLLFDVLERDGARTAALLAEFRKTGRFAVSADALADIRKTFTGARFDDAETSAVIQRVYGETGYLLDPHTAVGAGAAEKYLDADDSPVVTLATAHPAKFPDAVDAASGVRPALPPHLADLYDRPERKTTLDADLTAVKDVISGALRISGAA